VWWWVRTTTILATICTASIEDGRAAKHSTVLGCGSTGDHYRRHHSNSILCIHRVLRVLH
jgi:hypothetical protein